MPWHGEPMKDVESRDSLRRAAHGRYHPQVSEWGNPKKQFFTAYLQRQPGELKHLSTPRKGNQQRLP